MVNNRTGLSTRNIAKLKKGGSILAWSGSIKGIMKDNKGIGGGKNLQGKQDIGNHLVPHSQIIFPCMIIQMFKRKSNIVKITTI